MREGLIGMPCSANPGAEQGMRCWKQAMLGTLTTWGVFHHGNHHIDLAWLVFLSLGD